jgi:hypothetical protein
MSPAATQYMAFAGDRPDVNDEGASVYYWTTLASMWGDLSVADRTAVLICYNAQAAKVGRAKWPCLD